jgi:streptogramin lyase
MKPLESQINLKVANNTALPQPVSMLGIVANSNSANNSNILYEFNLTGQSFVGITNVNINISNTSNPSVIVNSAPVTTQSIQGVVDALNTLNQGIFSYSGSTIYVSSSYYIYSNISIAGVSIFGTTGDAPFGIVVDSLGNVYTNNYNDNNVSKITSGGVSSILATTGTNPIGITIDSSGNIYTANFSSNNVSKITPLGVSSVLGTTNFQPSAITIDSLGNIYTANQNGNDITKITPLGVSTNYGNLSFNVVEGMVVDSVGNVYVVCSANVVIKVTPAGVSTPFGVYPIATQTSSIAIDSSDNIYVSNEQTLWKLTPSAVQTIYGTTIDFIQYIAIDNLDNIYCTLQNGNIEKVLSTGGTTIIADLSVYGGVNSGIALDSFNNVYVCNSTNSEVYLIVQ